jgi:hypothetical protein
MKITLQNISPVPLHGKVSGETFTVDANDGALPVDLIWRKRLQEKAVQIVQPTASSSDASEGASSKSKQKGKA